MTSAGKCKGRLEYCCLSINCHTVCSTLIVRSTLSVYQDHWTDLFEAWYQWFSLCSCTCRRFVATFTLTVKLLWSNRWNIFWNQANGRVPSETLPLTWFQNIFDLRNWLFLSSTIENKQTSRPKSAMLQNLTVHSIVIIIEIAKFQIYKWFCRKTVNFSII